MCVPEKPAPYLITSLPLFNQSLLYILSLYVTARFKALAAQFNYLEKSGILYRPRSLETPPLYKSGLD